MRWSMRNRNFWITVMLLVVCCMHVCIVVHLHLFISYNTLASAVQISLHKGQDEKCIQQEEKWSAVCVSKLSLSAMISSLHQCTGWFNWLTVNREIFVSTKFWIFNFLCKNIFGYQRAIRNSHCKSFLSKNFHVFNFRIPEAIRKYLYSEIFPIYSIVTPWVDQRAAHCGHVLLHRWIEGFGNGFTHQDIFQSCCVTRLKSVCFC